MFCIWSAITDCSKGISENRELRPKRSGLVAGGFRGHGSFICVRCKVGLKVSNVQVE
jgi:hypothetical protein